MKPVDPKEYYQSFVDGLPPQAEHEFSEDFVQAVMTRVATLPAPPQSMWARVWEWYPQAAGLAVAGLLLAMQNTIPAPVDADMVLFSGFEVQAAAEFICATECTIEELLTMEMEEL